MSTPEEAAVQEAKTIVGMRRSAYLHTFKTQAGQLVLSDLARFCFARKSTYNDNPRRSAYQQGRKDVFERIEKYMNLSAEELWDLIRREKGQR